MLVLLVVSALAATPDVVKVASPGLTAVNVDAKVAAFFSDHFAQQLQLQGGVHVITSSEISTMLGFERQKQLLGCADEASSSCLAELSGALGVDALVSGSIARVGSSFVVNIKILDAKDARTITLLSQKLANEEAVVDWLSREAVGAADSLRRAFGRAPPPSVAKPVKPLPIIVLAAGVAALGTGVGLNLGARATAQQVRDHAPSVTEANLSTVVAGGQAMETTSWILGGVGLAGIVAGVTLLVLPAQAPAVSVAPIPGGGVVAISGALP